MENKNEKDAWLIYYSEFDVYPVCLFFEPQLIECYYKIDKVKVAYKNKGE